MKHGLPIWPYFIIVLLLNISVIFIVFALFDFLHERLMQEKWYRKFMEPILKRIHSKANHMKTKMDKWGYIALMLLVAVPLPGTGAWTGSMVAWTMDLNRVKSFIAIAVGVVIAGLLVLAFSLGVFNGISLFH